MLYTTSNFNGSAQSGDQYLEVFSSVPSYTIPSTVYFVGVDGRNDTVNGVQNTPGLVQDIFSLGGFVTGSNGYLALLQEGNPYTSSVEVSAGTKLAANTSGLGNGNGFGNGGSSSVFGSVSNVHLGSDPNNDGVRAGTNPNLPGDQNGNAVAGAGELSTDIQQGSETFLLIQAPASAAPTLTTNIDPNGTGTPGGTYNSWNVLDSVGIIDGQPGGFVGSGLGRANGIVRSGFVQWTGSFVCSDHLCQQHQRHGHGQRWQRANRRPRN